MDCNEKMPRWVPYLIVTAGVAVCLLIIVLAGGFVRFTSFPVAIVAWGSLCLAIVAGGASLWLQRKDRLTVGSETVPPREPAHVPELESEPASATEAPPIPESKPETGPGSEPPTITVSRGKAPESGLLDNGPWLKTTESCVAIMDEMDDLIPRLGEGAADVADMVVCRFEDMFDRLGLERIENETEFDIGRHKANVKKHVAQGTRIKDTVRPGFIADQRILRRAIVDVDIDARAEPRT